MKKSKLFLLCVALLCPIVLLTACTTPPSHLITASPSEKLWGRVSGAINTEMAEGEKINLTAVEFDASYHPFICWLKGNSKVVSTEKSIELEYNSENAGHYTALYDDQPSSMRYCTISSIDFDTNGYSAISFSLSYSSSAIGSINYLPYAEGTISSGETFESEKQTVLYFGSLADDTQYKFEIVITLTNNSGEAQSTSLKFNEKLSNSSFNGESTHSISNTASLGDTTITLNFQKLSADMFSAE